MKIKPRLNSEMIMNSKFLFLLVMFVNTIMFSQTFTKVTDSPIVTDFSSSIGSAWGDYDNDGDLDLFVFSAGATTANPDNNNLLFRNDCGGYFTRMTNITGGIVSSQDGSMPSVWIDIENDGDLDLLAIKLAPPSGFNTASLFINNNDGTFTSSSNGELVTDLNKFRNASAADYNNDGLIDIFISNNGIPNSLYLNSGGGNFTRVYSGSFSTDAIAATGAAWGDYDNDGDMDLFVGDRGVSDNLFYINNGNGTFTKDLTSNIVTVTAGAYGPVWVDYDNDQDLDLFIQSGFTDDLLFMNNNGGSFSQITAAPFMNGNMSSQGGSAWGDYDNDGDLDLFLPNLNQNEFFVNNGNGTFTQENSSIITNDILVESVAATWVDSDNDGDLDLYVCNAFSSNGPNNFFYENQGNSHHWLKIKCVGTTTNRQSVGARIYIRAVIFGNTVTQFREINNNSNLSGGGGGVTGTEVHFGLGDASIIEELTVVWPTSGITQTFNNVGLDQYMEITESMGSPIIKSVCHPPITGNINLGNAADFAVLSGGDVIISSLLNTRGAVGASNIVSGNVINQAGVFPNGTGNVPAALNDLNNVISNINSFTAQSISPNLNGLKLIPGVYSINTNATISGQVHLTGGNSDKYIFRIFGNLNVDSLSGMNLGNVFPENIYWMVNGSVDIADSVLFYGNIIATGNITSKDNYGRCNLLSLGNVILINTQLNLTHYSFNDLVDLYDGFLANTPLNGCDWVNSAGGSQMDEGDDITIDGSGNSYVTGVFTGTATFYSNSGNATLTSPGTSDMYLIKYDVTGNMSWIIQGNSSNSATARGVAFDMNTNSILVTGAFSTTATFGGIPVYNSANGSFYVARFDANTGALISVIQDGVGATAIGSRDITIDAAGNMFVVGGFLGTATFGGSTMVSSSAGRIFIARYNSNNTFVWVNTAGDAPDRGEGIVYNTVSSIVYVIGIYQQSITFNGSTPITFNGGGPPSFNQGFIIGYNALTGQPGNGTNITNAFDINGYDITVDASGTMSAVGDYEGAVPLFNGSQIILPPINGLRLGFLAKLNASGLVTSAIELGSPYTTPYGVTANANNDVFVTGFYGGGVSALFGSITLNPIGSGNNIYVTKVNPANIVQWAKGYGGTSGNAGLRIAANACSVYTTGYFNGPGTFDNAVLTGSGGTDMFTITSQTNPIIITASSTSFCPGGSVTLDAGPGYGSYMWSPGGQTTQIINVNTAGTYCVTVPPSVCCANNTACINITISPLPNVAVTPNNPTICIGGNISLTASGANAYTWQPATSLSATTGAIVSANPIVTTTYTVTGTSTLTGCTNTATVTVNVTSVPTSSFIVDISQLCPNNAVQFTYTGVGGTSFSWNFGDGNFSTAQNPIHIYSAPGYYYVTLSVSNICGTTTSTPLQITVIPNCCAALSNIPYDAVNDIFITALNTVWDGGVNPLPFPNPSSSLEMWVYGNIIVEPGASLDLDGVTLRFGPEGKIIVKRGSGIIPGGRLTLKNAILTSITTAVPLCPVMWQGIEVWGDPSKNHTPSDQPFQGFLSVEFSVIEHAHIGILVGKRNICSPFPAICKKVPVLAGYSGGIITTANGQNSEFRNCATGIYHVSYNPSVGPGNVGVVNNNTQFLGGSLLDPGYTIGNPYIYPGVTLYNPPANSLGRSAFGVYNWNVSDVVYDNSVFDNIERGLVAFDTRFDVTNSTFNNHVYGTFLDNTNSNLNRFHNLSSNTFIDNINTAIYVRNGNFDWIDNGNVFNSNMNSNQSANQIGIFLQSNTSRYQVLDNTFNYNSYGIIARNSGAGGGFIGTYSSVGNLFKDVNLSVRTGLNFFYNNNLLTIRCNNHNSPDPNPSSYFEVWHNNGLLANQGANVVNDQAPAGNEFFTISERDIVSPSGNPFMYYYHSLTGTTQPVYVNAFGVNVAKTSNSCTDPCPPPCFICCRIAQFNTMDDATNSLQSEYNSILSNLDNGQTAALLTAINTDTPPGALMNLLKSNSPLSDQVLLALIERPFNTPFGIFREIMLQNLPVSDDVLNPLDNMIASLPSPFIEEIKGAQLDNPGIRTLTTVDREINIAKRDRIQRFNEITGYYLRNDSLQNALNFILTESTFTNDLKQALIGYYIDEGDFTAANNLLVNFIPTNVDEVDWKYINSILINIYQAGGNLFDLEEPELLQIRAIAYQPDIDGSTGLARAILLLLFHEEITDGEELLRMGEIPPQNFHTTFENSLESGVFINENNPNPFSDFTEIEYTFPIEITSASLIITDLTGKELITYPLVSPQGTVQISAYGFKSGVYFYSLVSDNAILQSRKMVIIKE